MNKRSVALDGDLPFGALRLAGITEHVRSTTNRLKDDPISRRVMSLARRACMLGRDDPFDVDVFDNCRARLYPRSNRCEKRVFLGVNSWDLQEREIIRAELGRTSNEVRPFVFVDGGANVGLYSLYVQSVARSLQREAHIVSIEPDPTNLRRLRFNVAASSANNIQVQPFALGAHAGNAHLTGGDTNRGEVRLARADESDNITSEVGMKTLAEILDQTDIGSVDMLKLDIEGAEYDALTGLFENARPELWPSMIILEVGKSGTFTDAYHLCIGKGYSLVKRTQLNAIIRREIDPKNSTLSTGNRL